MLRQPLLFCLGFSWRCITRAGSLCCLLRKRCTRKWRAPMCTFVACVRAPRAPVLRKPPGAGHRVIQVWCRPGRCRCPVWLRRVAKKRGHGATRRKRQGRSNCRKICFSRDAEQDGNDFQPLDSFCCRRRTRGQENCGLTRNRHRSFAGANLARSGTGQKSSSENHGFRRDGLDAMREAARGVPFVRASLNTLANSDKKGKNEPAGAADGKAISMWRRAQGGAVNRNDSAGGVDELWAV